MNEKLYTNLNNIYSGIQAMKASGQSNAIIADRLSKNPNLDERARNMFLKAKNSGIADKMVNDFLEAFPAQKLASKEDITQSIRSKYTGQLGGASRFTGVEKLGHFTAAQLAKLSPEHRRNLQTLRERGETEAASNISRGGVNNRELAGSTISTAANLVLPFAGKALSGGKFAERVVKSGLTQAGLSAAQAASEGQRNLGGATTLGGLIGGGIPFVGATFRGLGVAAEKYPKFAYTKIFKDTADDVAASINSAARKGRYNPTLAEEMVDSLKTLGKTIKGSALEMGTDLAVIRDKVGKELNPIARASKVRIPIKDRKFLITVLQQIRGGAREYLEPDVAKKTDKIITYLQKVKSKDLSAEQALSLKQFIDKARSLSSFKTDAKLIGKQAAFKNIANYFRSELRNKIPELAEKLDAYRIAVRGFDAMVDEAVKEGNQVLIQRLDALAIAAGVATGQPGLAAGAAGLIHLSRYPGFLTKSAQATRELTQRVTRPRFGGSIKENIQGVGRILGRRTLANLPNL